MSVKSRVVLSGIAVSASVFVVAPSIAAGPKDAVNGGGQISTPSSSCVNHFSVNAQARDGDDAKGVVKYQSADCGSFFNADVVCVRVEDNRASVLAELRHTKNGPPQFEGGGLLAYYEDNGNPTGGQAVDRQQNRRLTPADFELMKATGCPPPVEPVNLIDKGNIHVTDGV